MSADPATSVDAALAEVLRPGQDVVIGQSFGAPRTLIAALPRHLDRLQGSRVFIGMLVSELPELPGVELRTFFPAGPTGSVEKLAAHGIRYERQSLYELAAGLRSGAIPVDVALAQGTPARDGRHSLGTSVDFIAPAAARADVTVLETGAAVPWTGEASTIAADRVLAVDCGAEPLALDRPPSAGDRALAEHVAGWVPDGATLQLGMGPWVTALVDELLTRRGLRVHSGLITDWLLNLEEAGALTADAPVVATGAAGTTRFYGWLDGHPSVGVLPADLSHAPDAIAALPDLRAINSVLEVDLLGQGNSEIGHGGKRGGVAGLSDFARGAASSDSGLSVIALTSTARDNSRIVARLEEPAISLPAGTIDVIVTEQGSTDLRGLDGAARARAILAVAHPEHRAALEEQAHALALL